jgi:hypothetical protein
MTESEPKRSWAEENLCDACDAAELDVNLGTSERLQELGEQAIKDSNEVLGRAVLAQAIGEFRPNPELAEKILDKWPELRPVLAEYSQVRSIHAQSWEDMNIVVDTLVPPIPDYTNERDIA